MVGFSKGRLDVVAVFAACRRRAHSPAWLHLCAVSVRWSRQNVPLQDSQRKGRKSSWWQYSNWQLRPIASRSWSGIWLNDSGFFWSESDGVCLIVTVIGDIVLGLSRVTDWGESREKRQFSEDQVFSFLKILKERKARQTVRVMSEWQTPMDGCEWVQSSLGAVADRLSGAARHAEKIPWGAAVAVLI